MRWPRRRRRKLQLDTNQWPLIYVGPTTYAGLETNSPCRPVVQPRSNGMRGIQTIDGNIWRVPPGHLISSALRKAGAA